MLIAAFLRFIILNQHRSRNCTQFTILSIAGYICSVSSFLRSDNTNTRRPSLWQISQPTRDFDSMLFQHWPTVYDVGPALIQHWISASCLTASAASLIDRSHLKCTVFHLRTKSIRVAMFVIVMVTSWSRGTSLTSGGERGGGDQWIDQRPVQAPYTTALCHNHCVIVVRITPPLANRMSTRMCMCNLFQLNK